MSFKICVVGCGWIASVAHGPACRKYADKDYNVVLAGCCARHAETAERFQKQFEFQRAYTDYVHMLQQEKPDVVLVLTPIDTIADIAIDIIKRGYPILLEKPPGKDLQQAVRIHKTALQYGVPVRTMFNRRYMPLVRELKKDIDNMDEPILHIDYQFIRCRAEDSDFTTTTIHGIDLVKFLTGSEYRQVNFKYQNGSYNSAPFTSIYMNAAFENGVVAKLSFMPAGGCVAERVVVNFTRHTFFLNLPVWNGLDSPGTLLCTRDGEVIKSINGKDLTPDFSMFKSNGFYNESVFFCDELRAGQLPKSDIDSGFSSVEIASYVREGKDCYKSSSVI